MLIKSSKAGKDGKDNKEGKDAYCTICCMDSLKVTTEWSTRGLEKGV